MPRKAEERPRERQRNYELTPYGRWIEQLSIYLETTPEEVSRVAGIHHSIIHRAMSGERDPKEQTAIRINRALRDMASKKRKEWHLSWDTALLNAAGYVTEQQLDHSLSLLKTVPVPREKTTK